MQENNGKNCRWIEVFMNVYGDRIEKCLCHLNPESKRVDLYKDCQNCKNYAKENEEKEQ
jgi:hypothetical protein